MAGARLDLRSDRGWTRERLCPGCGFRGYVVENGRDVGVFACPVCDADWYARPPRSYAEMEGLDHPDSPEVAHAPHRKPWEASCVGSSSPSAGPVRMAGGLFGRIVSWLYHRLAR